VTVDGCVDQIGTVLFGGGAEGEGKLAAGVDAAVQDVGDSVAGFLAGETGPEDGAVVRVSRDKTGRVRIEAYVTFSES
jgi:hypothetical protein